MEQSMASFTSCTVTGNGQGIWLCDSSVVLVDHCTVSSVVLGIALNDASCAVIRDCSVSENAIGIMVTDSSQATITRCSVSDNSVGGILLSNGLFSGEPQATIKDSEILRNGYYGIRLDDPPCTNSGFTFTGHLTGGGNTIPGPGEPDGNAEAICPDVLSFLMTPEGGELDRRLTP
jgi:parallel beta-helix repeat protein